MAYVSFLERMAGRTNPSKLLFQPSDSHYLRMTEEMANIDTKEADAAFSRCFRSYLRDPLKRRGFFPCGTVQLSRVNHLHLLEVVRLHKEGYGSKTFTADVGILPLYVPYPNFYPMYAFGDRLGCCAYGHDFWWDFHCQSVAEKSFQDVYTILYETVLPWFESISTYDIVAEHLKKHHQVSNRNLAFTYMISGNLALAQSHLKLAQTDCIQRKEYLERTLGSHMRAEQKEDAERNILEYDELFALVDQGQVACKIFLDDCIKKASIDLKLIGANKSF